MKIKCKIFLVFIFLITINFVLGIEEFSSYKFSVSANLCKNFFSYEDFNNTLKTFYNQNINKLSSNNMYFLNFNFNNNNFSPILGIGFYRSFQNTSEFPYEYYFSVITTPITIGLQKKYKLRNKLNLEIEGNIGLYPTTFFAKEIKKDYIKNTTESFFEEWIGTGLGENIGVGLEYFLKKNFSIIFGLNYQIVKVNEFKFNIVNLSENQKNKYEKITGKEVKIGEIVKISDSNNFKFDTNSFILKFAFCFYP
ncbi:MAG: hypothetical protein ABIB46_05395 [bacterium]